jgi:hypothetical protein
MKKNQPFKIIDTTKIPPMTTTRGHTEIIDQTTKNPELKTTENQPFKIINPTEIPPKRDKPPTEKYYKLIDEIPKGKTLQITDNNEHKIKIERMWNIIENNHHHQKLTNIKLDQRTIIDKTTTPPTKTKYLYMTNI